MAVKGAESAAQTAVLLRQRKNVEDPLRPIGQPGEQTQQARRSDGQRGGGRRKQSVSGDALKGLIFMCLLALQYALQPVVSKKFIRPAVIKTTVVLVCEVCKIVCALGILVLQGPLAPRFAGWSVSDAFLASALPAGIYAVQNVLVQGAYPHLDSLTLTMLNQTKLLFTALFTALILGQRQSGPQVVALLSMLLAAVLLSWEPAPLPAPIGAPPPAADSRFLLGVLPMLVASVLSGLASTVCQRTLQVRRRDAYVMTVEMSVFGIAVLLLTLPHSQDGHRIRTLGFFHAWERTTLLPVLLYAAGGILVGLVTKYVGGLKKGFAIVVALLFTAIIQLLIDQERPSGAVVIAMPLVTCGVLLHSMFPYRHASKRD